MIKNINYGRQYIDDTDIRSVASSLRRDKITTGQIVEKFENKINNFLKCKYSLTCNSGTSALFLALQTINLKKNDKIIMPCINFISSYNVAKIFGAKVFLADVDKKTGQMTPDDVINCCRRFKLKKVKALIMMFNGGYPQNAENFIKFKKKLGCVIIEDACHAFGAEYISKRRIFKVGSCKHSDISTFSLHPLKTITTGEGGIITTNSKKYYFKIRKLRSLGIERNSKYHWKYDVVHSGLNFRLTDFQCALGISQLNKINIFLKERKKIAEKYDKELNKISKIIIPIRIKKYKSSNHLYIVNLKKPSLNSKQSLFKFMLKNKIFLQYHYIPLYKFKFFNDKYISNNADSRFSCLLSIIDYYFWVWHKDTENNPFKASYI